MPSPSNSFDVLVASLNNHKADGVKGRPSRVKDEGYLGAGLTLRSSLVQIGEVVLQHIIHSNKF